MSQTLPVAQNQVRDASESAEGSQERRKFPKAQQPRHIRKAEAASGPCNLLDFQPGPGEEYHSGEESACGGIVGNIGSRHSPDASIKGSERHA